MSKKLFSLILAAGILAAGSLSAAAEEDYSYLDDMTINELKKLDEEIHKRIPLPTGEENTTSMDDEALPQDDVPAEETRNEEIVLDEPITVIDNADLNIKVTGFFREVFNEGTDDEFIQAGFRILAENKTQDHTLDVIATDCSLSDKQIIEFSIWDSNYSVVPGKALPISFARYDGEDFENLEDLYELEGNMEIQVFDDQHKQWYSDQGEKIPFSIPESLKKMEAESE